MLAFACFIQKQSRRASRSELSDAKQQGSNERLHPEGGSVYGGDVSVPRTVQDTRPFGEVAAAPAEARPQPHSTPTPTRLQRMPELLWAFVVRHWRTLMVIYACCSFFLRFCEEVGELGAVSPRPSQPELASGSIMYMDIDADLPEVPPSWASMPAHMVYAGIPSKAASQKIKENGDPVVKTSRVMKSFTQASHGEVRSKSRSHQALVYIALAFSPVALALSCALVFSTPGASTA